MNLTKRRRTQQSNAFLSGGSRDGTKRQRGGQSRRSDVLQQLRLPSGSDACKAHRGPVSSMDFTPDGLFLLTGSSADRLRLWDMCDGTNMLVHYATSRQSRRHTSHSRGLGRGSAAAVPSRPRHRFSTSFAVAQFGASAAFSVIFLPSLNPSRGIGAFRLHSGVSVGPPLRGHFGRVRTCVYRPSTQELFSAGDDGLVAAWSSRRSTAAAYEPSAPADTGARASGQNADTWSSDSGDGGERY